MQLTDVREPEGRLIMTKTKQKETSTPTPRIMNGN